MTLLPRCEEVETKQGVAVTVTAAAQVMVMAEDHMTDDAAGGERDAFMKKALEQFVGKSRSQIEDTILQTLEGHLRAILGTLTVEEIYKDRESFARLVREVASPDIAKMGLEILSFTIKDVVDSVQYLESLGKGPTAAVQRDADIGKAEAIRDSGIAESTCQKQRMAARYDADTAIANSDRQYMMQQAAFDEEVNRARADADLAFTLQSAKCRQDIRKEQVEIEVVETHREIEVEQQEVIRKEKELVATVNRPAEAERFKVETLAEGNRTRAVLRAQGEAESIKAVGAAEAFAIQAKGEAEAAAMAARATAFQKYGDAATVSLVLEALPKIAAEISAPLAKTKEIVLVSGDESMTGEISKLVSQLPPAVQALTGVNLTEVCLHALPFPTCHSIWKGTS
ncbi:uncharacterized protein MONBRDRAFT_33750 [Monosiga brevicollis MX1]|uniref:Band 7 domain-containing protein n=1 Tax=Monosiga brevicollis TaxID=81824 RepID=A9V787_MONBE|nr:uncharacterized protein MONBRDRAFT_33750 [Monosiga brevicollis MX1]EDQ86471.1 predicted protein [Monosiga brevicollis MX1]|eukprot:XP_001748584.1 hypothetical protein [Monosiga brevicollis MX1]